MSRKIGIACSIKFSLFAQGTGQTVLHLAEVIKELEPAAQIELVAVNDTETDSPWWEDCNELKHKFVTKSIKSFNGKKGPIYDLFIDMDGFIPQDVRQQLSPNVVVFLRKSPIFIDIEASTYPMNLRLANTSPRYLDGVSAVWIWDLGTSQDDVDYLNLLTPAPVRRLPYIWRPTVIESHYKEAEIGSWFERSETDQQDTLWTPHIMETNMTNASSCIIPMVILYHLAKEQSLSPIFKEYFAHNTEQFNKNADFPSRPEDPRSFFQINTKCLVEYPGIDIHYMPRQRLADMALQPKSMLLSHQRFVLFRPILLDAAWAGIPTVHNSPLMRELGCGWEELYYPDNEILEAGAAFKRLDIAWKNKTGIFASGAKEAMREKLAARFGCKTVEQMAAWRDALISAPALVITSELGSNSHRKAVQADDVSIQESTTTTSTNIYRVLFTDMWDDFNPKENFFIHLLRNSSASWPDKPEIIGVETLRDKPSCSFVRASPSLEESDSNPDHPPNLVIFGPFGDQWRSIPETIPKVHFTGEWSPPIQGPGIKLNLGYSLELDCSPEGMRLPLWMLEVNWFGVNPDDIVNPKPLPLAALTAQTGFRHPTKFCAFIVSNPMNAVRNDSFLWLSQYKPVDSAGRVFNTIGDAIFAGRGGGGGELKKYEFLKDYKFCLVYENQSAPGYTTEKFLHAKMAGCIPIYWGDPKVARDFLADGFINAQECKSAEELIAAVRRVDEDDELWRKMRSVPALDEYRRDLVRRRFSELSKRMWKLIGSKEDELHSIPQFVGDIVAQVQVQVQVQEQPNPTCPVFVTFCTGNYIGAMETWVNCLKQHKAAVPDMKIEVWLGEDIDSSTASQLVTKWPEVNFIQVAHTGYDIPIDFPDFWNAQHFAWKLWLLYKTCINPLYKNHYIFYTDCASLFVRWPVEYMKHLGQSSTGSGIILLEDTRQKNRQWCHDIFRKELKVTQAELDENQIWAGGMIFIGGSETATKLFNDALEWGRKREVIVGPKWSGFGEDGKPYGHRHDQSILSILSSRHGIPRYPLDKVYCDTSIRRTFKSGAALYVHRGQIYTQRPFAPRISEAHMISLKRRSDRVAKFDVGHPGMLEKTNYPGNWAGGKIVLEEACDGRALPDPLPPALAKLFSTNDFGLKKGIVGCALSHLRIWVELAEERDEIENFLILEDDCRLNGMGQGIARLDWEEWAKAAEHIPADYDILYLGGVLPPNREQFQTILEPANQYWSRVQENNVFGQNPPTRYFHFCNYAYIMTKKAAQKVLALIEQQGFYTSGDHMICNQVSMLNHYVLTKPVADCFQDDDETYKNSVFNDFSRTDKFDSDLWNDKERFSNNSDINNNPIDIKKAIQESSTISVAINLPTQEETSMPTPTPPPTQRAFLTVAPHEIQTEFFLEKSWLQDLTGMSISPQQVAIDHEPRDDSPIFLVQKPHIQRYKEVFERYAIAEKSFYAIHLSDEFLDDDISWYDFPYCTGVVRFYPRSSSFNNSSKVLTIPLGYAKRPTEKIDQPLTSTPSIPFRSLSWSFRGTNWFGREEKLKVLEAIVPGEFRIGLYNGWRDAKQVGTVEYIGELLDTIFSPCPRGQHFETFRLYESLNCGTIPIIVREPGDNEWIQMLSSWLPLLNINNWEEAGIVMNQLLENKELMEKYRESLLIGWTKMRQEIGANIRRVLCII